MSALDDLFPGIDQLPMEQRGAALNGNPHMHELILLYKIIVYTHAQTVFEIGTFMGTTAAAIATLPGVQRVWTLDLPPQTRPALEIDPDDWNYIGVDKVRFPETVTQVWGDTATFDASAYAGKCDVVFVMGAHSPGYMRNDLRLARELVSTNGVIVWHAGTEQRFGEMLPEVDGTAISERMAVVSGMKAEGGRMKGIASRADTRSQSSRTLFEQ